MKTISAIVLIVAFNIFLVFPAAIGYWTMENMEAFEVPLKFWIIPYLFSFLVGISIISYL